MFRPAHLLAKLVFGPMPNLLADPWYTVLSRYCQVTFIYIALLTIQIVSTAQYQNRNIFELKAFHY